jgi:hypothetical protein
LVVVFSPLSQNALFPGIQWKHNYEFNERMYKMNSDSAWPPLQLPPRVSWPTSLLCHLSVQNEATSRQEPRKLQTQEICSTPPCGWAGSAGVLEDTFRPKLYAVWPILQWSHFLW